MLGRPVNCAGGGFLAGAPVNRREAFIGICFGMLALQAAVSLADFNGLSARIFENPVHGALAFAPTLFVDLGVLAAIGLSGPYTTGKWCGEGDSNPQGIAPTSTSS